MEENNSINSDLEIAVSNDNGTVVVGEGVKIDGRIEDAKDTHISGTYSGSVKSDHLIITESGNLSGDIKASDISISGNFTGDLIVENSLTINNSGKAKGNFEYKNLDVRFGATIEGMVKYSGTISSFPSDLNEDNNLSSSSSETPDSDVNNANLEKEY